MSREEYRAVAAIAAVEEMKYQYLLTELDRLVEVRDVLNELIEEVEKKIKEAEED